jgi:putative ABC transport system permease protein
LNTAADEPRKQRRRMKFLRLISKNLFRHKRRNLLTLLSIAASLFLFSALYSLADVPALILRGNANSLRLVCHNKAGLAFPLPESYARKIAALPHVRALEAWDGFDGIYQDPKDRFPTYAVDAENIAEIWPEWGISAEASAEFRRVRNAALAGPDLVQRYHWKVGQLVTLHRVSPPLDATLQVVGVLHSSRTSTGSLNLFLFNREYLESSQGTRTVGVFWVQADSLKSIPDLIAQIDSSFSNSDYQTQTEAEGVFISSLFASLGVFFTIAKGLSVAIAIAIMLVAANTAAMSIRERSVEIAVMRAMGFSSRLCAACLLAENIAIAISGGAIGCLTTLLVLGGLAPPLPGINSKVPMSGIAIAVTLSLSAVIGILSAAVPAGLAVSRSIVDDLRRVG